MKRSTSYDDPPPSREDGGGVFILADSDAAAWYPAPGIRHFIRPAGGRTVIGFRCKPSGMFWGGPGAENVLALRCTQSSHRLGEFWKERLNTHAARNDSLALAA